MYDDEPFVRMHKSKDFLKACESVVVTKDIVEEQKFEDGFKNSSITL